MRGSSIVLLSLVVVASGCVGLSSESPTSPQHIEDVRANAEKVPYSNLVNYPDRVRGDAIKGTGKAIQNWNSSSGEVALINTVAIEVPHRECGAGGCYISGSELKYTKGTIYASFSGESPENGTLVNYWGIAKGTKTYENSNGRYLTVPKIDIVDYNRSNASLYVPE